METIIYLIRHAQSAPSADVPHADWPLSEKGNVQAENLVELLLPLNMKKIFCSPFLRCQETIRPFSEQCGLPIQTVSDLRERKIAETMIENFLDIWQKSWVDISFALPNCESSLDGQERFAKAIYQIVEQNQKSVIGVSTHGNVIGLFLNYLDNSFQRIETEQIKNPDVFKIVYREDKFNWDKEFVLSGLDSIASQQKYPVVKE